MSIVSARRACAEVMATWDNQLSDLGIYVDTAHLAWHPDSPCCPSEALDIPSHICIVDTCLSRAGGVYGRGSSRLEFDLFITELPIDCALNLTCLLQELRGKSGKQDIKSVEVCMKLTEVPARLTVFLNLQRY